MKKLILLATLSIEAEMSNIKIASRFDRTKTLIREQLHLYTRVDLNSVDINAPESGWITSKRHAQQAGNIALV